MGQPRPLLRSFQQTLQFLQYLWKKFHPVSGAGIRTHDLFDVSLLPYLLDQGSRLQFVVLKWSPFICRNVRQRYWNDRQVEDDQQFDGHRHVNVNDVDRSDSRNLEPQNQQSPNEVRIRTTKSLKTDSHDVRILQHAHWMCLCSGIL